MSRTRGVAVAGLVVAVLLSAVAVTRVTTGRLPFVGSTSAFERAIGYAPSAAQRLSWTDWSGIRDRLGSTDLDVVLEQGFERDLTSTSALVESAPTLEDRYGISPATISWELFAQSDEGAAVLVGLPDGDAAEDGALARTLVDLGYAEPDDDGIRAGSFDLLARIGQVTPELAFLALDDDHDLLVGSDTRAGVLAALDAIADDEAPDVTGVVDAAADAVRDGVPLSAAVFTGAQACNELALVRAGPTDQAEGEALIADAGGIDPLTGLVLAADRTGDVVVTMSFADDDQARRNADARARLAAGPAPGQGGDFGDRFRLGRVSASDGVVTMRLQPRDGAYVLSDLANGPLLFASC